METQLNKNRVLLFTVLITSLSYGVYCQNINKIDFKQLNISGITFNDNSPQIIEEKLGKPESMRQYGPVIEWHDGSLYYQYDSIEVYFEKYGDKFYLIHMNVESRKYPLSVEGKIYHVGDTISSLVSSYPLSYEFYLKQYPSTQDDKIKEFYLIPCNTEQNNNYCGSMTIRIKNDIINSFYVNFTEGN